MGFEHENLPKRDLVAGTLQPTDRVPKGPHNVRSTKALPAFQASLFALKF